MSSHSNFNKDKCWSCEYFSGKREYKKGTFLGDSVHTDVEGRCSNNRSTNCNHEIFEDSWCSKYQKWGVLQSALAVESQKKESQRILNELHKEQQKVETTNQSISPQERLDIHARWEELEHQEQIKRKQREISVQQSKINKINRSPVIAGVVTGVITLFLFLLGWIPCWYWDSKLTSDRKALEQMFEWGHTMQEVYMQELYADGLHAKEMRNSVIWIPFVILAIGIVATTVVVVLVNKAKPKRLFEAHKRLDELEK